MTTRCMTSQTAHIVRNEPRYTYSLNGAQFFGPVHIERNEKEQTLTKCKSCESEEAASTNEAQTNLMTTVSTAQMVIT